MGLIKIKRIDDREFASIGHIWDKVCRRDSANIFQMFEWACNWWKVYGHDKELLLLVVTEDGSPIAIAPLVITKEPFNRLSARKVEFMYRMNFIIHSRTKEVIREVLNYLKAIQGTWDIIDFTEMDYDLKILDLFKKEAQGLGFDFLVKDDHPYPYMDMGVSWEEYLASRSNKFKKNLRYSHRLMERMGNMNIAINIYDNAQFQEIKKALDEIFILSLKSWKAKLNTTLDSKKMNKDFYKGLVDMFSRKGKVEVSFLEHKGVPIAGTIGFIYKNVFYGFNTYYDEQYAKLSPGNILMQALLKEISSDSIVRVEFLKGLFPQKLNWLTGMHKKAHVTVFKKSPHSRILKYSETHLRRWIGVARSYKKDN